MMVTSVFCWTRPSSAVRGHFAKQVGWDCLPSVSRTPGLQYLSLGNSHGFFGIWNI